MFMACHRLTYASFAAHTCSFTKMNHGAARLANDAGTVCGMAQELGSRSKCEGGL